MTGSAPPALLESALLAFAIPGAAALFAAKPI